jgi:hypothetical protein
MLFMWVFSLGACLANACLSVGPAHAASQDWAQPAEAEAVHLDAAADEGCHQHVLRALSADDGLPAHQEAAAKTNCQDFCGKATVSIPPLKSALDDVQAHALIATVFTTTALPVLPFTPTQPWVPRRDGVQAPPILLSFLRLAL